MTRNQAAVITRVLDGALRRDEAAVDGGLNILACEGGWEALFRACCAFAAATYGGIPNASQPIGLAAVDSETGREANIEDIGLDEAVVAALRIVTAIGNHDFNGAAAIFCAAVDLDYGHDVVAASLALAVSALKRPPGACEVRGGGR